jgi:2'-5' RNA ligase
MALFYTKLPHETERLLTSGLSLPNVELDVEEWKHITLVYLGDDVPLETVAQAMVAAYDVVSTTPPFTVRVNEITTFPKNDSGLTPVICRIHSPEIHYLQERLCVVLDHYRIAYSKKFPEYKPHVTLGYTEGSFSDQVLSTPVEWGVHEIHLGAGDERDQRCCITYPLRIDALKKRVAARYRDLVGRRV